MEKADLNSSTTKAKIMGSLVSISGALIILCKGPTIMSPPSSSQSPTVSSQLSSPSNTNWVLGGFLLAVEYILFSVWYTVQAQIIELYPVELIVVMSYFLCGTLISAPVYFLAKPKLSAWILKPDITMVSVMYSGIFTTCLTLVHSCCISIKGPVYVSVFRPLFIAIASASSVIFLGEALHFGRYETHLISSLFFFYLFIFCVVGAVILSIGFYAVLWGKAKEGQELSEENGIICVRTPSNSETPLLQSYKVEDNRETMALGGKS